MAKKAKRLIYTPSPLATAMDKYHEAKVLYEREYELARRLERERNERVSNFAKALHEAKLNLQREQKGARLSLHKPSIVQEAPTKAQSAPAKVIVPDNFEDL